MFKAIKCCQTSVDSKDDKVIDDEVEEIYNAIIGGDKDDEEYADRKAFKKLNKFIEKYNYDEVRRADRLRKFTRKNEDSNDTLLHTAALCNRDSEIIDLLLQSCPDLINIDRTGSCSGQTALHITIAKEKIQATELILYYLSKANKKTVLSARATGSNFANTIMMGETALSVAVLTFNTDIVDLLLNHEACVDEVNNKGDTVIHTLIKYTALDRKIIPKAILMLRHLKRKWFQKCEKLWFQENKDRLTPLKLAVKEGLIDIVQFVLNIKDIYCFKSQKDGSFDSRRYDITEIDPAAQHIYCKGLEKEKSKTEKNVSCLTRLRRSLHEIFFDGPPPSVIEMMNELNWKDVQEIVDVEIIKLIVLKRWERSFSFVMYIILSGNEAIIEFSNFENTTLTMFGYMHGLKELDLLKDLDNDSQRLVAGIYVLFIITTYIILINSLIAMMTSSAQAPAVERQGITLLLRSSVSLFLDGVFFRRRILPIEINEQNRTSMPFKMKEKRDVMSQKMSKENFTLNDVRKVIYKLSTQSHTREKDSVPTFTKTFVDKWTQVEAPTFESENIVTEPEFEIYPLG